MGGHRGRRGVVPLGQLGWSGTVFYRHFAPLRLVSNQSNGPSRLKLPKCCPAATMVMDGGASVFYLHRTPLGKNQRPVEAVIFLAVLALATDEPPLSGASAQTAGFIGPCFRKINAP